MAKHKVITSSAEIDQALIRAKNLRESRVLDAAYNCELNVLVLQLSDGQRRVIPVEGLEGLQNATKVQLSVIEILGSGTGLRWPEIDVDLCVTPLLQSIAPTE